MSVNQESMANGGLVSAEADVPDLEYVAVRRDSLSMFGAAIGGAILGMLLTLLVLAILNNGTLRYVGGASRLGQVETAYNQLSLNVGTNTSNIETLSANMNEQIQGFNDKIGEQNGMIDGLDGSIADLDSSRGQFDTLVDALSGAINVIKGNDSATEAEPSSSTASAAAGSSSLSVLFFADANGNQEVDAGEESLVGIAVSLVNAEGDDVATQVSTDGGMSFEGLEAGDYTLMVMESGDYSLASDELGTVTVNPDEEQSVFIAVGSE